MHFFSMKLVLRFRRPMEDIKSGGCKIAYTPLFLETETLGKAHKADYLCTK